MEKIRLFVGVALLFLGTSIAVAQSDCNPCEQVCGSESIFRLPLTFNGWIDTGVYTNSHGFNNNGPMHTGSQRRTDFVMSQLYFGFEKEMNTRRGFDWGARTDFVYGAHAGSMQTYGDETFDFGWGANKHGYEMSAYKLYGTLGYKDLSVKVGKFVTIIGWEESASKNNFFYSHSYCYWIEPATHMGVLADYALTDRLSLSAGWVTGEDSSFANPNDNGAILTGFSYSLTENATVYYAFNGGKQRYIGAVGGIDAWNDYFIQSICLEWMPTERLTYVLQYDLRNDNVRGGARTSAYGINNHVLYKLNDQWGVGARLEWLRDNGAWVHADPADYYQITLGLNWNPRENVRIRPEVRYDLSNGSKPFGPSAVFGGYPDVDRHSHQVSGGCAVIVSF